MVDTKRVKIKGKYVTRIDRGSLIRRESFKGKYYYVIRDNLGRIKSKTRYKKGDSLEKQAQKYINSGTLNTTILSETRINKNLKVFSSTKRIAPRTRTQIGVNVAWYKRGRLIGITEGYSNKLYTKTYSEGYDPKQSFLGRKLTEDQARKQAFNRALGKATEQALFRYDDPNITSEANYFYRSYSR